MRQSEADEPFCWYIVRLGITDEYETVFSEVENCPGPGWKPLYEAPISENVATTPVSAIPAISGIPLVKMFRDQRDKLADALRLFVKAEDDWRAQKGGMPEGTFDDALSDAYKAAQVALKDVPTYEQQLRNVAAGLDMNYDELLRCLASGTKREGDAAMRQAAGEEKAKYPCPNGQECLDTMACERSGKCERQSDKVESK